VKIRRLPSQCERITKRGAPGSLRFDFQVAKKILIGLGQSVSKAASALPLKVRFFVAERDEGLTVVSVAHRAHFSYPRLRLLENQCLSAQRASWSS
jgi:hypothetical protein